MSSVILIMLVGLFSACSDEDAESHTQDDTRQTEQRMTDEDYESLAAMALLSEISNSYYSDSVDAGSSTYEVASVDKSGLNTEIYGTVTLYDKYGKVYGDYRREFSVTVDSDGDVQSCYIES